MVESITKSRIPQCRSDVTRRTEGGLRNALANAAAGRAKAPALDRELGDRPVPPADEQKQQAANALQAVEETLHEILSEELPVLQLESRRAVQNNGANWRDFIDEATPLAGQSKLDRDVICFDDEPDGADAHDGDVDAGSSPRDPWKVDYIQARQPAPHTDPSDGALARGPHTGETRFMAQAGQALATPPQPAANRSQSHEDPLERWLNKATVPSAQPARNSGFSVALVGGGLIAAISLGFGAVRLLSPEYLEAPTEVSDTGAGPKMSQAHTSSVKVDIAPRQAKITLAAASMDQSGNQASALDELAALAKPPATERLSAQADSLQQAQTNSTNNRPEAFVSAALVIAPPPVPELAEDSPVIEQDNRIEETGSRIQEHQVMRTVSSLPQPIIKADEPQVTEGASTNDRAMPILSDAGRDRLVVRAKSLLGQGDIAGARLVLEHLAHAGDAGAAETLARTFDPAYLELFSVQGLPGDVALALKWYEVAETSGSTMATARIEALKAN